jgi:hypothetical protein
VDFSRYTHRLEICSESSIDGVAGVGKLDCPNRSMGFLAVSAQSGKPHRISHKSDVSPSTAQPYLYTAAISTRPTSSRTQSERSLVCAPNVTAIP